jgi:hypothetical protein
MVTNIKQNGNKWQQTLNKTTTDDDEHQTQQ